MLQALVAQLKHLPPHEQQRVLANIQKLPERERTDLLNLLEEAQARERKKAAQGGLEQFALQVHQKYIVGPHHRALFKLLERASNTPNQRIIVNIAPRMGKLLADETPVYTPLGWRTHGELKVGDYVYHPSGKAVKVLAVMPKAEANVKMTFSTGEEIYCHEQHEWVLYNMARKRWETREANDFLKVSKTGPFAGEKKQVLSKGKKSCALHHLPLVAALDNHEVNVDLPPYILGAWLGDGSTGKACFTHSKDDQPYIDKITSYGYTPSAVWVHKTTGVYTTAYSGPRAGVIGKMGKELQALGIYTNKHIPEIYKRGSIKQRLELLAGLIDTDGHVDKAGRVIITAANRLLIDGIVEVAMSLGFRPYVSELQPRLSSSGIQGRKVYWTVGFQPTMDIPTALPRKKITRFAPQRRIGLVNVEKDPQGKTGNCIQVDSEDGLYVVGKTLIATHNSEACSYLFPAWYLGHHPDKKIIMGTHTAGLSTDFGRRVRDLVGSDEYKAIFPNTVLNPDAKAAGAWNTNKGGQYYAVGVGGALAGRGADLFVIDDPISEQVGKNNSPEPFLSVWDWFSTGPLQRLMPGGSIVVLMTRWNALDLTGMLVNHMAKNPDADQWEVVEFPAILNEGEVNEKSLWPEFWPLEELKKKRAGMDPRYWQAQYMQNPTSEEGALIKREWWMHWEDDEPPEVDYIVMSLDAAQEAHNRADYNALTVWGVFHRPNDRGEMVANIVLLDAWRKRMEFPELKRAVYEAYKEWKPQTFIVEKKSNGAALYQEMRAAGVPVDEFTPSKGNDKISRVNAVSDMFSSGMIWAPTDRMWAKEVINECAEFPAGANDDFVDSCSMALMRIRKGGFIRLPSDYEDEPLLTLPRYKRYY